MSGKKRSFGSNPQFKRPRVVGPPKQQTVQSLVKKAIARVAEKKYFDVTNNADTASTSGEVIPLGALAEGNQDNNRIGNEVTWKSLAYHFQCTQATTVSTGGLCRVILFIDRQCNGVAPSVTTVLQAADFRSFINIDYQKRFQILDDTTVSVCAGAGIATAAIVAPVWIARFKSIDLAAMFGSTSTSALTNALFMLVISDVSTINFSFVSRARFTDL